MKSRIATKYHSIEQELLNEFVDAHKAFVESHDGKEIAKMKELASTLSYFKGTSSPVVFLLCGGV